MPALNPKDIISTFRTIPLALFPRDRTSPIPRLNSTPADCRVGVFFEPGCHQVGARSEGSGFPEGHAHPFLYPAPYF